MRFPFQDPREIAALGDKAHTYIREHGDDVVRRVLVGFGLFLILFGFLFDTPSNILSGLYQIAVSPCGLITDYLAFVGVGAAFVNAGLVTLTAVALVIIFQAHYSGILIASVIMSGGFALFGKNFVNIWPIYLGVYLYSRFKKRKFADLLPIAFFSTSLGPLVSEMGVLFGEYHVVVKIAAGLFVGIVIGFIMPPLARWTAKCHQGYNLFNVGFATGIVATVVVAVLKSFGYTPARMMYWSVDYTRHMAIFLYLLFFGVCLVGFWLDRHPMHELKAITKHSGLMVDFLWLGGFPASLINMGLIGLMFTTYILVIGGDLNGPTAGCIISVAGFGACGFNLRNTAYVALGVIIGSFFKVWTLTDPSMQLCVILCTGLAPIAGEFGLVTGIVAGLLHSSVVRGVGELYSALNLYNNGFSTGFMALFLVPLIREFHPRARRKIKEPEEDPT